MKYFELNRRGFIRKSAVLSSGVLLMPDWLISSQKKKVSLLGDSIRMGYQWMTSLYLEQKADVWSPEENTRHTVYLIENAHKWIKNVPAEIIHVNAGLHDIKCMPYGSRKNLVPLDFYAENVERIIKYIHSVNPQAVIIWATTTPVLDDLANEAHREPADFSRYNEDVIRYNEAARKVTERLGIPVNDLYDFVMSGEPERIIKGDGVHFTDTGYQFLGEQVANAIRVFL